MFKAISEESLGQLVDAFYARVRQDELIGPLFNDAVHDWADHLERLQAFWSSVMLTSGRYKGRPLPAHLQHSDRINSHSFERWLEIWGETTSEMFEPAIAAALQEKATRIAESLQLGIRFARGDGLAA